MLHLVPVLLLSSSSTNNSSRIPESSFMYNLLPSILILSILSKTTGHIFGLVAMFTVVYDRRYNIIVEQEQMENGQQKITEKSENRKRVIKTMIISDIAIHALSFSKCTLESSTII